MTSNDAEREILLADVLKMITRLVKQRTVLISPSRGSNIGHRKFLPSALLFLQQKIYELHKHESVITDK